MQVIFQISKGFFLSVFFLKNRLVLLCLLRAEVEPEVETREADFELT